MIQVKFYDTVADEKLQFAVIAARSDGKWVFCRHKARSSWELPGGHREPGEKIEDTACRELYEETGALKFQIEPLSAYSVKSTGEDAECFGMLYAADVHSFDKELHSEIAQICITDILPENWTYPEIQPVLMEYIQECLLF